MSITAAAKARRSQGVGMLAQGPERASETKAIHWHVYVVEVPGVDVVVKLYAAQDADGRWYGSDSVWFGKSLDPELPKRDSVMSPATAEKWKSEEEALRMRCAQIRLGLGLNRMGFDGAEGTAIDAVGCAVAEWEGDVRKHIAGKFAAEAKAEKDRAAEQKAKAATSPRTPKPKREIVQVAMDKIHRHPHNRTILPASCQGLAESLQRRGLLSPIRVRSPGEHWMLPEGHLQLIDGERRLVAAQTAGWDTIAAEVVEISDAEAEAEIAAANGQRQGLNEIEIADRLAHLQRPVADGGGGLTQTAAAAEMGIAQPTASLLESVARLPDCWRQAVIAGEIPGSFLRPLAKYAAIPEVLELLWADYTRCAQSNDPYVRDTWGSRRSVEESVEQVIADESRPLTAADKCRRNEWNTPKFEASSLTPKQRTALRVFSIEDEDGGTVQRCAAVKVWEKLQTAREAEPAIDRGSRKATKPKVVKPQRTPAEQRKLDADADKKLCERITLRGGLAEIALRIDLAAQLKVGDYVTNNLHDDLVATTRNAQWNSGLDYNAWKYLAERLVIADRLPKGQSPPQISGHATAEGYQKYSEKAIDWENDPATDGDRRRWYVCRLLLWPYSEVIEAANRLAKRGEWPERFPWCESSVLEFYATITGAQIRDTWVEARDGRGAAGLWFEQFIRTHNTTRQRQTLCEELGVSFEANDKLATLEQRIVAAHKAKALPLPAVLRDWPKAKGKKSGRSWVH